jgi:transposase
LPSVAVKRRRRFSVEQKRAILSAAAEYGTTVAEVSRRFGVTRSLIHNWRRQEAVSVLGATVRFTPVVAEKSAAPPPAVGRRSGLIEIELDGGVRLRVDATVDEGALKRVLRALDR